MTAPSSFDMTVGTSEEGNDMPLALSINTSEGPVHSRQWEAPWTSPPRQVPPALYRNLFVNNEPVLSHTKKMAIDYNFKARYVRIRSSMICIKALSMITVCTKYLFKCLL